MGSHHRGVDKQIVCVCVCGDGATQVEIVYSK